MTKPLYFYNGTTFELVGPTTPQSPIAYQTSAPTGPATGDLWIDSDGDVDTYNRQLTRYYFVATAAQTTISGVDANSLTLAYVAGSEQVYVNGALQVRGQDYTATNGTSVVMSSGLAVNDVVEIFAYTAFTVANAYTKSETDGIAAAAPGLRMVVPTSVAVGSGSGSVDALGNVTFSGASSVSLNGCFTSTYDNYVIVVSKLSAAANASVTARLRLNGSDESSGSNFYKFQMQGVYGTGTTFTGGSNGRTDWDNILYLLNTSDGGNAYIKLELTNPSLAITTAGTFDTYAYQADTTVRVSKRAGIAHTAQVAYDGISFIASASNLTGTIRVYGYKD